MAKVRKTITALIVSALMTFGSAVGPASAQVAPPPTFKVTIDKIDVTFVDDGPFGGRLEGELRFIVNQGKPEVFPFENLGEVTGLRIGKVFRGVTPNPAITVASEGTEVDITSGNDDLAPRARRFVAPDFGVGPQKHSAINRHIAYTLHYRITRDSAPTLSVSDAETFEGVEIPSGLDCDVPLPPPNCRRPQPPEIIDGRLVFHVSLSAPISQTVTVQFATADGTARAPDDYEAVSGTLTFNPGGPLSQPVSVPIKQDSENEPDETMFLNVSNIIPGVPVIDGEGMGTIHDGIDRLN
jgi:hypothetical protein